MTPSYEWHIWAMKWISLVPPYGKSVFVSRDKKDRCSGQQKWPLPQLPNHDILQHFSASGLYENTPFPAGGWRRWHHHHPQYIWTGHFEPLGSQHDNPSPPEATQGWEWFPQSRNAYLTVQLIVVKYLESWNDGKSLHILARNYPADIQFPNRYTDLYVLRGAS